MINAFKQLLEAFSPKAKSGYASPQQSLIYETPTIPLADVIRLYERDPACKASVDLLAASSVGMGFYTTVNPNYERVAEAKRIIDDFNESINLDAMLCDMARVLIACGNDFWLKITPSALKELHRLPVDAMERIEQSCMQSKLRFPCRIEGYKLRQGYGGETLRQRQ